MSSSKSSVASSHITNLVMLAHLLMLMCHAHSLSWKHLHGTRKGDHANGLIHLKKYLARLGYIDYNNTTISSDSTNDDLFDEALESAIKKYQGTFKYNITGILDEETVELLSSPRCGVPDHRIINPNNISGLSETNPYVWPSYTRHLSYSFDGYVSTDASEEILAAMVTWEESSPFSFKWSGFRNTKVRIGFKRLDHGDGDPFDGPGGTLAHAFFPTVGILHFDGDEAWDTFFVPRLDHVDLQTVALHELGHILGLEHSKNIDDIMYPMIKEGEMKRRLSKGDKLAISLLYPK